MLGIEYNAEFSKYFYEKLQKALHYSHSAQGNNKAKQLSN